MPGNAKAAATVHTTAQSNISKFGAGAGATAPTLLTVIAVALLFTSLPARAQSTTVAGVTPGALAVDQAGMANYSIGIAVPPGIAGMEPSLSLNYSSGGGNGIAGAGWGIGGLSVIHRCPRTPAQDGQWGGIGYDDNDRFCLDGKRLVAINGVYGADGTEYRTEVDGFFKVVSYGKVASSTGVQGSSPEWFRVWTKSGQVMDYGATADSRVEAIFEPAPPAGSPPEVRNWTVSHIADTVGNYMTFSYIEDTVAGAHRIDRIDYTFNDAANVAAQSYVEFVFEQRPDTARGYPAGALSSNDVRLSAIRTFTDGALVRDYRLIYEMGAATGRSRLVSVTECDGANNCLAPHDFGYSNQDSEGYFTSDSWPVTGGSVVEDDVYTGDFDGDGKSDLLQHVPGAGWRVMLSRPTGFEGSIWSLAGPSTNPDYPLIGDFNGDGLSDFLQHIPGTGWRVLLSTGSGFQDSIWTPAGVSSVQLLGDFNGDGLTDFMQHIPGAGWRVLLSTGSSFEDSIWSPAGVSSVQLVGDFNGDGLSDFTQHIPGVGWRVLLSTGSSFENPPMDSIWIPAGVSNYQLVGDFNGDGLSDFTQHIPGTGWRVLLSTGSSFENPPTDSIWTPAGTSDHQMVGDFNGDGLSDFIQDIPGAGWRVLLSTGSSFQDSIWSTDLAGQYHTVGDFNGDGLPDLSSINTSSDPIAVKIAQPPAPDFLHSITGPLGATMTLTYKRINDPAAGVYEKYTDAVFPVQDVQGPMRVVSQVAQDNGVGGVALTSYYYEGAKVDLTGRGFLGFRYMHSVDEQTGIVSSTAYAQGFPLIGHIEATQTYIPDPGGTGETLLSRTTNTYDVLELNPDASLNPRTLFPYVSRSVGESFEVNDGLGNLPVTTVTTDSVYDGFGNPTRITVTTTGGGESFTTDTVNIYTNDSVKWHLGRLIRATVTNTLPDLRSATRVSAFAYDPVTGLLTQEVIEPDNPALRLVTDYTHDVFGHRDSTTVSGADIATRTTTADYPAASPNFGRFATTATNALGHTETRAFDARFGTPASLTGPNGITTTWQYDGFGRKILESRADGTETRWDYALCAMQCPADAVYLASQQDFLTVSGIAIGGRSAEYFDLLNRTFRSETQGFDGSPVYADTVFDALGQVEKASRPYFAGTPAAEIQWTTTTYDAIGRPKTVTSPDGGSQSIVYDGLTTITTNALGQTARRTENAIGQLVGVLENENTLEPTQATYVYDPFGNLEQTSVGGVVTAMSYDIRGRKILMDDPDMGSWTYAYNALGELVSQTDAKGQTVTMTYDLLGRMISRAEPEGTTFWDYDNAFKTAAIGKPDRVSRAQDDYVEDYTYDSLGRPLETVTTYEGRAYAYTTTYDAAGRVETQTYPAASDDSRFAVANAYNALGYLESVSEFGGAGTVYWQALDIDAEGNVTEESLGNGLTTRRDFDPATGLVNKIRVYDGLDAIKDQEYKFDFLGNLEFRIDHLQNRKEEFAYDDLNRVESATLTDTVSAATLHVAATQYDAKGNITWKSDVGGYSYGDGIIAGPHAVTQAGNVIYSYDANGAMESAVFSDTGGQLRTVAWSSFHKPVRITGVNGALASEFVYGPDRARVKQTVIAGASVTKTITYMGAFERHAVPGAADELVHYIAAGGTVAIFTKVDDGSPATDRTRYLHRDHLGSVDLVTDEAGLIAEARSFDPWGRARNADWTPATGEVPLTETRRGFTGHEHIDSVGLIHMNGRVYDPVIGRFMSADPTVAYPDTTQGFNRYSYTDNNPLSRYDPSGFGWLSDLWKAIKKWIKPAIAIAVAVWLGPIVYDKVFWFLAGSELGIWSITALDAIAGAVSGATVGAVTGAITAGGPGARGGALSGGLSGGLFAGIGGAFEGMAGASASAPRAVQESWKAAKTIAHGIAGGTVSVLRGGKFAAGFAGAAFAEATSGFVTDRYHTPPSRITAAAVLGGTGSVLGGGKFANGAITGAFQRLYNDDEHDEGTGPAYEPPFTTTESVTQWALPAHVNEVWLEPGDERWGMTHVLLRHNADPPPLNAGQFEPALMVSREMFARSVISPAIKGDFALSIVRPEGNRIVVEATLPYRVGTTSELQGRIPTNTVRIVLSPKFQRVGAYTVHTAYPIP